MSFSDVHGIAADSVRTVLFLRHSYRQSLQDGTHDPGLTERGMEYALECGELLRGLGQVSFGASPRLRTVQTAEALAKGAGLKADVKTFAEIGDTAMFIKPEYLDISLDDGSIVEKVRRYFLEDGKADGAVPMEVFSPRLLHFLTDTDFGSKNTVLVSHDIIVMAVLAPLNIYPFSLEDWCGNIQGACLSLGTDGKWKAAYIVPDLARRERSSLFV